MRALAWVTPGSLEAVVDRTAALPADARITLLAVIDSHTAELAADPAPGRLGRHRAAPEAGAVAAAARDHADALLGEAARRLGRPAETEVRTGRVEHAVAEASEGADVLVLARDGEARRGPKSLGRRARFVVDHAGCEVVLVWTGDRSERESRPLPPPPR